MDAFPESYVAHNIPLVALSGIKLPSHGSRSNKEERGELGSQFGSLDTDAAAQLLHEFLRYDGSSVAWNSRSRRSREDLIPLKIQPVGPTFEFPSRKAAPPTPSREALDEATDANDAPLMLHSPISPLSPNSPLFPDGLMTPLWTSKHQDDIPAMFISCFGFEANPNTNSLHDNQLKSEINRIKGAVARSGYRTRYAVVLLGGASVQGAVDADERLANIRRATGLDAKTSFFYVPTGVSDQDRSSFVSSVLSAISPLCIEYYRDLTKHARRKKGRSTVPPPTLPPTQGTSQALRTDGWNIRYEFKLGIFAEFRQELDAAGRHYLAAIEALFAADGPFQTTPTWSPRWDEVRLLADVTALRNLRSLLWNGQTTSAVRFHATYREQLQSIIDQRGKGTACYGWQAWESRWAKIFAELIQRADLPCFAPPPTIEESGSVDPHEAAVYAPVEKAFPVGERIAPWEHLHHPGYWLFQAAKHARNRKQLALEIPDEDRRPPGRSPASHVAHRTATYDTYLCPEPHIEHPLPGEGEGYDHTQDVVTLLEESSSEYSRRNQHRFVDHLRLQAGREWFEAGQLDQALAILKPLWKGMRWRNEGWWASVSETTYLLNRCAHGTGDAGTILATEWELLHRSLHKQEGLTYDFMRCLEGVVQDPDATPSVRLEPGAVASALRTRFAFETADGHVADTVAFQLELNLDAHGTAPLVLSEITVALDGPLQRIMLSHQASEGDAADGRATTLVHVRFEDVSTEPLVISGSADLTLVPGRRTVLQGAFVPRRPGELRATNIEHRLDPGGVSFTFASNFDSLDGRPTWWLRSPQGVRRKHVGHLFRPDMTILPKPPKVDIALPNLEGPYYTDEEITLVVDLANHEDDEVTGTLQAELLGQADSQDDITVHWGSGRDAGCDDPPDPPLGPLAPNQSSQETIRFTAPSMPSSYTLEISVTYRLGSDPHTPLSKTVRVEMAFAGAFEANYEFAPRLHPDPWPSYFHLSDDAAGASGQASGITQAWSLDARVVSFAESEVVVLSAALTLITVPNGASCAVASVDHTPATALQPRQSCLRSFKLAVRKSNHDDRRALSLDVSLAITWRRSSAAGGDVPARAVTSTLGVPRLLIPNSEPRVLAHAGLSTRVDLSSPTVDALLLHMSYTLENPSLHYLTFDIAMEASSDFAFSGPKVRALNLLPMSRRTVEYVLHPLVQGEWVYPLLRVQDRYFNKTLRVLPTRGAISIAQPAAGSRLLTPADVRVDKRGVSVWIPTSEGQAEESGMVGNSP